MDLCGFVQQCARRASEIWQHRSWECVVTFLSVLGNGGLFCARSSEVHKAP